MTRGLLVGLSATLALAAGESFAGPKSGLQVGDSAGPFNIKAVTGPKAGDSFCYR